MSGSRAVPLSFKLAVLADPLRVEYPVDGATLTALQLIKGEPIPVGRARVEQGVGELPFFVEPDLQAPILLSASLENAVSVPLSQAPPIP